MDNARSRFKKIMNFQKCDRSLNWEIGYWLSTSERWYEEGLEEFTLRRYLNLDGNLPGEIGSIFVGGQTAETQYEKNINKYFSLDKRIVRFPVNIGFIPTFEEKTIKEEKENVIKINTSGQIVKIRKDNTSMPQWLEFPVKSKKDFKSIKSRLEVNIKKRLPEDIDELIKEYKNRDYVLGFGIGLFMELRVLLGVERMLLYFYDRPEFINEILDYLTDFYIELFKKAFSMIDLDLFVFAEDLAYKNGSLISPKLFKEFFMPRYKKIIKFLTKKNICDLFMLDSDGDCRELIPLFIESGINVLFPLEVMANMAILELRKKFPKLGLMGGVDKIALIKGKEDEIDRELNKVDKIISLGGYIPCIDHNIPPDISFEKFKYYREKLNKIIFNNNIL